MHKFFKYFNWVLLKLFCNLYIYNFDNIKFAKTMIVITKDRQRIKKSYLCEWLTLPRYKRDFGLPNLF